VLIVRTVYTVSYNAIWKNLLELLMIFFPSSLESWSDNKGRLLVYINHILLAGSISDKCFLIFIHIQHHANIESSILYIFLKNSMLNKN
jgi:hypothetical protein